MRRFQVLVVHGANWCGDCKVLDLAFKEGAAPPRFFHDFVAGVPAPAFK